MRRNTEINGLPGEHTPMWLWLLGYVLLLIVLTFLIKLGIG